MDGLLGDPVRKNAKTSHCFSIERWEQDPDLCKDVRVRFRESGILHTIHIVILTIEKAFLQFFVRCLSFLTVLFPIKNQTYMNCLGDQDRIRT